jgi:hypothetical protein
MHDRLRDLYDANLPANRFLGFERRNLINTGGNSIVVSDGENVFKIYTVGRKSDNPLTLHQVSLYQEITNSLGNNIVPINEIGFFEPLECPYSVSKFIEGPNLEEIFNHGTGIRNLQRRLHNLGFNPESLKGSFSDLSKTLNNRAGTKGINIVSLNVKLSPDNEFIITDLCAEIKNLRRVV